MSTFETLEFFRGVNAQFNISAPQVQSTRKDRKPRNLKLRDHLIADEWFFKKFGYKFRSQSVFVSSRLLTARGYAYSDSHVVRVIPLSNYKFCWSPIYNDLLEFSIQTNETNIIDFLNKGNYLSTNLEEAYRSGHEVMLFCDQYITIPISLLKTEVSLIEDEKPIILMKTK